MIDTLGAAIFGSDEAFRASIHVALRPMAWPLLALFAVAAVLFLRAFIRRSAAWPARGIPELSPAGLAAFRVAYGGSMVFAVSRFALQPLALDVQRQYDWFGKLDAIRNISASETAGTTVHGALLVALTLFTIGFMPRLSLFASAVLMTVFASVLTTHSSIHDWGLPTMAMWLMLLAPWQEGFGVSWAWRRWRGLPDAHAGVPRGLALWIPGFALGIAFLAAAYAKMDASGLIWITDGAVRYHFIEDASQAPVDWGLRIAASSWAPIVMSFGAVAAEATFWLVTLFRQPSVRALFLLLGLSLLGGFYLFQGVFWTAWWVLLLGLVPWTPLVDRVARALPRLTVLADGECPLCRRTVRWLHALDWFDRLSVADASNDRERERAAPGLERTLALTEMYVVDEHGRLARGYDAYVRLARSLPPLWPALLVGALPPVAWSGRRIYARAAAARTRRGRCSDDVCAVDEAARPFSPNLTARLTDPRARSISRLTIAVIGLFVLQQLVVSTLRIESEPLWSNFPMYDYTWGSREAFDAYFVAKRRRYVLTAAGLTADQLDYRLRQIPEGIDVVHTAIDWAIGRRPWTDEQRRRFEVISEQYRETFGEPLVGIEVVSVEQGFDWDAGAFASTPRLTPQGVLDPVSGTMTTDGDAAYAGRANR
jgi:predicted DCC family thiol-disulfide oxidoreductase YuxK